MILPKFYYKTGTESDKPFILLWMRRIKPELQKYVSSKYESTYKEHGREKANIWLEEYSKKFGEEPNPGFDKFASKIENLIRASRVKRGAYKNEK